MSLVANSQCQQPEIPRGVEEAAIKGIAHAQEREREQEQEQEQEQKEKEEEKQQQEKM